MEEQVEPGDRSALHDAAMSADSPKELQQLIDEGAKVNRADRDGVTPLHLAAGSSSTTVVAALLDAGADLEAKDQHGNTPLWKSLISSHPERLETVRYLLNRGANPGSKNNYDMSPREMVGNMSSQDLKDLFAELA